MRLGFELTRSEFTEKLNECIYYACKVCKTASVSYFEKFCEMVTMISYAYSFHEFLQGLRKDNIQIRSRHKLHLFSLVLFKQ